MLLYSGESRNVEVPGPGAHSEREPIMGVYGGLAPSGVQGQSPWSDGHPLKRGRSPLKLKALTILKLLGCCFPGLFQPNTQVFLAIQVR